MDDSLPEFSKMLQNQSLSVKDILSFKQLGKILISNYHPIFQYISNNSEITLELMEWCFSTKHITDENFNEFSQAAIATIISTSNKIPDLLKNRNLLNFFISFLKSEDSKNFRLAGYFSRLFLEQLDAFSYIFEQFDNFAFFLVSRIQSIGIQDLIVEFVKCGKIPFQCRVLIAEIASIARNSTDCSASLTLCRIYKTIPRNSQSYQEFNSPSMVNTLADAAINSKSPFVINELISVVTDIVYLNPSLKHFTESQVTVMKLTKDNITPISIEAVDIFYNSICDLFEFFFLDERLHGKLIQKFQMITDDSLIEIAQIPNFIENLIKVYGTDKWCPHCEKVAIELGAINLNCEELQSEEWLNFFDDYIAEKLNILNNTYGGSITDLVPDSPDVFVKQFATTFKFSPSIGQGYTSKEEYPEEEAQEDSNDFVYDDDENGEEYIIDI